MTAIECVHLVHVHAKKISKQKNDIAVTVNAKLRIYYLHSLVSYQNWSMIICKCFRVISKQ